MKYVFYGRHLVTNYRPAIMDYYGVKVGTLGEHNATASREEFFRKDNVHAEIKANTYIDIGGENVYINSIIYDIMDDSYRCNTDKVLSTKDGNMTKQEAEQQLNEMQNRGILKRFWRNR